LTGASNSYSLPYCTIMQKSRGNVKSVDHESTIMLSMALNREREKSMRKLA